MPFITRQVAAVAAVFALSAGPALASSTTSSTGAVKAKTSLTEKIATETPLIRLGYTLNQGVDLGLGANAVASDDAALIVGRIHADSAQLPAKLEWVLGADVQRRADNTIAYGQHEKVYNHPARGDRAVDEGSPTCASATTSSPTPTHCSAFVIRSTRLSRISLTRTGRSRSRRRSSPRRPSRRWPR